MKVCQSGSFKVEIFIFLLFPYINFRLFLILEPPPIEEEYDPRTLYERLQEQKTKKEEAFQEMTRFSMFNKELYTNLP